ncbi:glutamate mutase L [Goodfellowiella coeruleoviolacea]|uniref:Glutamate mutase n=1 Tax=Goodfellowiella coeruleoviolacea TaxID=334858 RepID=A0AAE3GGR8_9PSEU|nr:glutamate mutase L [Goodfellowiella coeruleoviolacea]MCP2167957.1 hypothetical protein [Goodfellowiella coeruleoviolacea]
MTIVVREDAGALLCLDVGSTWTKAALVAADGRLVGTAQHPTTPPEVLHGIGAVTEQLAATDVPVLACSSAGGGLRLAVVGQERLVSAEAGYRVALSAGAKVVHVSAGELTGAGLTALRASRPDLVLLAGGTDGGDTRVLLHNAGRLARNRLRCPIVLAGNTAVRDQALALLAETGRTVIPTANVLPDVGELAPGPARAAIRAAFLRHVIGGKGLSRGPRFRRLVRAVTPDAVLTGVARLVAVRSSQDGAEAGAVLVVDVGGATTDVYSALPTATARAASRGAEVGARAGDSADDEGPEPTVALPPERRTVEGDLGMRWSAPGVVAEAEAERLIDPAEAAVLAQAAGQRGQRVDWVPRANEPGAADEIAIDLRLAALAVVLAVRRHLRLVGHLGARGAGLLVLSGGVFRHAGEAGLARVEQTLRDDPVLRPVLRQARVVVDRDYALAPAGLLADAGRTATADALLTHALAGQATAADPAALTG